MLILLGHINQAIEQFNSILGRIIAWCVALMAIITFGIVVTRGVFNVGSIAVQEVVTYLHASLFLLCIAFTAQNDGHVRVDVLYRDLPPNAKAWINACGAVLLLLPFALFMILVSLEFVANSWSVKEGSSNPGGLPLVFLLKTLIPVAGILMAVRAISEVMGQLYQISFLQVDELLEMEMNAAQEKPNTQV